MQVNLSLVFFFKFPDLVLCTLVVFSFFNRISSSTTGSPREAALIPFEPPMLVVHRLIWDEETFANGLGCPIEEDRDSSSLGSVTTTIVSSNSGIL